MTLEILGKVQSLVGRIAKIPPPEPDVDMYTAGLASVDALELLVELEETFSVTIPDDRFVAVRTPQELAALIDTLSSGDNS